MSLTPFLLRVSVKGGVFCVCCWAKHGMVQNRPYCGQNPMRPAYKQKIQRLLTWNRWIYGPSGENRTHGLLNPIVLLSKTQCTIRYCLDSVSLNFKCIISFCFIGCQDVSFLLWSNCGQTTPTNDFSPPAKLHRAISIFINRSCAFCLHELSIRRICQPCQWTIVVFSSLTELYDPWLLLRTGRRTIFVLPHSKGSFSGAAVSRSVNRCQNPVRHSAWSHEPFC